MGKDSVTTIEEGLAPIASTSETLTATVLRPTDSAGDHCCLKCTPSMRASVVIAMSPPSRSTAQSSPGPRITSRP